MARKKRHCTRFGKSKGRTVCRKFAPGAKSKAKKSRRKKRK